MGFYGFGLTVFVILVEALSRPVKFQPNCKSIKSEAEHPSDFGSIQRTLANHSIPEGTLTYQPFFNIKLSQND